MKGLSIEKAKENLAKFGYNELPGTKPKNIWSISREVMREPMFLLLVSCGLLYLVLGDYREGIVLLSCIFLIILITFYQFRKSETALEALKKLSAPRALVIRDGVETRITGREVVPGDLIVLHEGDRIPADARILDSINLTIDESLLTGESMPVRKEKPAQGEKEQLLYSSTLVVHGRGLAEVISTGTNTAFGQIGQSISGIQQEESQLQKESRILIRKLFIIGCILSVAVVLAFYFTRGNFIQSLLNGLAAAMAILPEEFPVVMTVFMAVGAWRLSKNQVLTRNPAAIETLGSATVLCTDKTGTITQNKMEIVEIGINDTILSKKDFEEQIQILQELLTVSYFSTQENSIDPMDKAIQQLFVALSLDGENDHSKHSEFTLSKELLVTSRIYQNKEDDLLTIYSKGAPEAIFRLCRLTEQEQASQIEKMNAMASKGLRVIGIAGALIHKNELPQHQHEFQLRLLGLLGFADPVRPEVPAAIMECKEAGIRVIMITGDYPATARSIGQQIGLPLEGTLISGEQLKNMSDEELRKEIPHASIFARVQPDQKLRIVKALKDHDEIVAMTGDGVNDAPALKAAHIGIAMGNKGTDVAREAASLVLLDDNFTSIVSAIRSGRRIFDNLQKAMSYILSIHIPIIGLALLPALLPHYPILLMPLHIVFMELIIDPISSIAFESESEEVNLMKRPPRKIRKRFFGTEYMLISLVRGSLLCAMVLAVYFITLNEPHDEKEVRTIAFTSFIIGNMILIITDLSNTRSFLTIFKGKNYPAIIIMSAALLILYCITRIPALQVFFSFKNTSIVHYLPVFISSMILLGLLEGGKYIRWKKKRSYK